MSRDEIRLRKNGARSVAHRREHLARLLRDACRRPHPTDHPARYPIDALPRQRRALGHERPRGD